MTMQEVFDTVAKHLLAQQERAMMPSGTMCAYRAPNGNKCAFGCLINDSEYDPIMEGMGVKKLLEEFPVIKERLALQGIPHGFLRRLQTAHDNEVSEFEDGEETNWLPAWRTRMKRIAFDFQLSSEAVNGN